jgi:hypothetical protein
VVLGSKPRLLHILGPQPIMSFINEILNASLFSDIFLEYFLSNGLLVWDLER